MPESTTPHLYRIYASDPNAHLYEITLTVEQPDPQGQQLRMPAWIPGSYMIRDYARNVIRLSAQCNGEPVATRKLDKDTWVCEPCEGTLAVTYEVYAWDLSVRGAHLDATHAYFNGACVFLEVLGQSDVPCRVDIRPPANGIGADWKVATGMPREDTESWGYGIYRAESYDEFIDYPVEMGNLAIQRFDVRGTPHFIAFYGRINTDIERICGDLAKICDHHIRFFGETAPFDNYLFLVTVVGNGYGGLEHRNSTSLLCSRGDLPAPGEEKISDQYRMFLGLCSHEYFHAWNVKRIKPEAYVPYDLSKENYTRQLWWFEGVTSYYDDLALVRTGLIDNDSYLELLGQTITRVLRGSGRTKQSVADSSFDAWSKFYKQDENAPNAIVSYYSKGALIALGLDMVIRGQSSNRLSLDNLIRRLWYEYGETGVGVPEGRIEAMASEICGTDLSDFFQRYLYGTEDLPLADLFGNLGIEFHLRPNAGAKDFGGKEDPNSKPRSGIRLRLHPSTTRVNTVYDGGAAQQAGIAPGDELVAINGIRSETCCIRAQIAQYPVGTTIKVHAFRRDELMEFDVVLQEAQSDTCYMKIKESSTRAQIVTREQWLWGGETMCRINLVHSS